MDDSPYAPSPHARAVLSFPALMAALWRGRFVVIGCVTAFVLIGLVMLSTMKPLYTATMLISPKAPSGPKLSGIASLYTSALGLDGDDPNFTLFLQSLTSYRLAKELQDRDQLLQKLAPGAWDEKARVWRRPTGFVADTKSAIKSILHMPQWSPPDYRDLALALRSNIAVTRAGIMSEQTSVYQIAFKADDPQLATNILGMLYWGAEDIVREQQRADLTTTIGHLHRQLQTETSQDVRTELVRRILMNETQIALLQKNQSAATTVIDPPFVPKTQSFPDPKLTMLFFGILGVVFGLVCGALFGFFGFERLKDSWRQPWRGRGRRKRLQATAQ